MKVALIADIHSNLEALERVLEDSAGRVEAYYLLGDLVGYGPDPVAVIDTLRNLPRLGGVMGNHDQAVVTGKTDGFRTPHGIKVLEWTMAAIATGQKEFLKSELKVGPDLFHDLLLTHGGLVNPFWEYTFDLSRLPENIRYLVCGHSHYAFLKQFEEGRILFNPGSVGQPRDCDSRASYGLIEIHEGKTRSFEIRRVPYEIGKTVEKMKTLEFPEFLCQRLFLGI